MGLLLGATTLILHSDLSFCNPTVALCSHYPLSLGLLLVSIGAVSLLLFLLVHTNFKVSLQTQLNKGMPCSDARGYYGETKIYILTNVLEFESKK